jgi:hypothetical protein
MPPSHTPKQNSPRRLRLHDHRPTEPWRPGEPADYPRGYIEQLARTFSDRTLGSPPISRRRRSSRSSAAAGLG